MTEVQREMHRTAARKWAANNPEKRREINRRFWEKHKEVLREQARKRIADMPPEEKREYYRRQYALYKVRLEANPEYAAYRRAKSREAARKYIASHKAEHAAWHKAYVESHKEQIAEYERKRRQKPEVKERRRKARMKCYYKDHDATLRKRKEYRLANAEAAREQNRRAEVARKRRKQTDATYYAKRRAGNRVAHAKAAIIERGKYSPRFNRRFPDYVVMGAKVLDVKSPYMEVNVTDAQRAYAKELATERIGHVR